MMKTIKKHMIYSAAWITAYSLNLPIAYAQPACNNTTSNIGEITNQLSCEVATTPKLFSAAAYIMGTGFTIAGLVKLKEYVDNPSQSFMKDALIRLGVGALLIALPFAISISSNSVGASASTVNPTSMVIFQ